MHQKTRTQLFKQFKTKEQGLSDKEVSLRLKQYGKNAIKAKKKTPLWLSFLEEFTDLMVIILILAAVIAGIAGEMTDASVILFIVVLNAIIGFVQKFKAEKALEALQRMLSPTAKVIRNGKVQQIQASQLVPGDIIVLGEGDSVPADARLLEENELKVDESALTGESVPVHKQTEAINKKMLHIDEHQNMIFMGTSITHGTGKALVIHTGMTTEFGEIANLTQTTKKDKSPLQKELNKIGVFVGKITLVISGILVLTGLFLQGESFVDSFLFATSVAVAAVPEGLPATITIALAIGVQRLAKNKAIVKKLSSVETLGSTTVICSDKTGTLTQNEMTVLQAYVSGQSIEISGSGYSPKGDWDNDHSKDVETLCRAATLCNNAKYGKDKRGRWDILGDPTEGALIVATAKTKTKPNAILKQYKRVHELPFDSVRKMMTTVDQHRTNKKKFAHMKGAPDAVLDACTHVMENGKAVKLTPTKRKAIEAQNNAMANKALRVLGVAHREIKGMKKFSKTAVEQKMVFLGLMGMIDPPRPDVYNAVEMAHKAGIKTYVITGDYGPTALAIARDLGIVRSKKTLIVTGKELEKYSVKKLERLLRKKDQEIIFARVSPEHKLKIVRALKHNGEIVAMTGDGVNDAPALKRADIGVAMGITGTDVSKEAADMILVDDSYGTIVNAIEEGRTIYDNLRKFVFYIFSCNIGELVTVFTAIILSIPAPLTAILILAVDLGTDVLPAIALGVDPTEPGIMERKPRSQKDHIMTKGFIVHFVYLGFLIGAVVVAMYFWMLNQYGWEWGQDLSGDSLVYLKASTSAFALLVIIQMVNAFNSRSLQHSIFKLGVFTNRWLVAAIGISLVTVYAFVELPFFNNVLHTTSLTGTEWGYLVAASFIVLIAEESRKFVGQRVRI
jgi:calcium-translocating P-type ATPase